MEQFSLEKYLANPSRKVVTRDGSAVKIHCTNFCSSKFPIVAEIEGRNFSETFTKDGHYNGDKRESPIDLFFAPEKHEGWINIYNSYDEGAVAGIWDTKEKAVEAGKFSTDYVTTIKIEWEEQKMNEKLKTKKVIFCDLDGTLIGIDYMDVEDFLNMDFGN